MRKVVKNILTNKERKDLIKYSKPLLVDGEEMNRQVDIPGGQHFSKDVTYFPPSKQTWSISLDAHPQFKPIVKKIFTKAVQDLKYNVYMAKFWVNWNNGKKNQQLWHHHDETDYAVVYYMRTFPFLNNGTCFKDGFVKAPQNSLIIFSAEQLHSVPAYPIPFHRYTLAMNLNIWRGWDDENNCLK